jgi:catechol 2,3-dioxygenase-like lactoylglutathione lyase family enzyme
MAPLAPHYHVGIVVPDVAVARGRLTDQLGVTWGPLVHLADVEYRDASGDDLLLPTTFCYSVDEPRIELLEEVPGSVWVRNEHSNLHHIGFWSDDLPGASARLIGGGCPLQFCGRTGEDAPVSFAYHRDELGVRIEIVDEAMRDAMSFLFEPDR